MGRRPAPPIDEPAVRALLRPYYRIREVALVINRNPDTVRRKLGDGEFPHAVHIGGSTGYLVPRADLVAYLKRQPPG